MKKFEYKSLIFKIDVRIFKKPHHVLDEECVNILNDEGKKGWEIVSTIPHDLSGKGSQEVTFILKREIPGQEKSFF